MESASKESSRGGEERETNSRVMGTTCSHNAPRWKRILDTTCIILALPAVLPLLLAITLLIKMVSPGPVLIRQQRIGYRRTRFGCLKFRTMHVCADSSIHQRHVRELFSSNANMTKMDSAGDPRLIRFGGILRALGLDELPQLWNVWRGEMSLVGPRPCLSYELDCYRPWQQERFDTLPGLTGLWQVSGKNKTTFSEMVALDVRYVRSKSLLLDVQILLRTYSPLLSQVKDLAAKKSRPVRPPVPSPIIRTAPRSRSPALASVS